MQKRRMSVLQTQRMAARLKKIPLAADENLK
jgi:hypothetical protein